MFEIDDYKENQTCALDEKPANLIVTCKKGTFTRVPICGKCLDRLAKMRAAKKPDGDRFNSDKPPANSVPVGTK